MKKVHIVYVQTEGAKCSYHCRTYLDLAIGDKALVMFSSGEMRLGTVTDIKLNDNSSINVWAVMRIDIDEIKRHINIGTQLAELDKAMMTRYEDFVRNEGFEELAGRDPKMQELWNKIHELSKGEGVSPFVLRILRKSVYNLSTD